MNIILKISLSALILALCGAVALLVYMGHPIPFIERVVTIPVFERTPVAVISAMELALHDTVTAQYEFIARTDTEFLSIPIRAELTTVFQGQREPVVRGSMTTHGQFEIQTLRFLTDVETRLTSDWVYVRFSEVPAVPFMELSSVDGVWYRFPNASGTIDRDASTEPLFAVTRRLEDVDIGHTQVYQYEADMRLVALRSYLPWIPQQLLTSGTVPVTLHIGKFDSRLYMVAHRGQPSQFQLIISRYGEPVTVTEPAAPEPFENFAPDLFQRTNLLDIPLFGALVGIDLGDVMQDPDADGLYTFWENIFASDPSNADSDQDGFPDGGEIRNGYNPIGSGHLFPVPVNE